VVGRLVSQAEQRGVRLAELPTDVLSEAAGEIAPDVADHLGADNVAGRYQPEGSAGRSQVADQIRYWTDKLG
jgi:argininosuccinate lyase